MFAANCFGRYGLAGAILAWAILPAPASEAHAIDAGWRSTIEKRIEDAEYEVTWQKAPFLLERRAGWQAPNRAHEFRTYFANPWARVMPRRVDGAAAAPGEFWERRIALRRWGRADAPRAAPPARIEVEANRVVLDREGIVESFVNDRTGLLHEFVLALEPAAAQVHLDLAVEGTLTPRIGEDGRSVGWTTPDGTEVLRDRALRVEDARGGSLPCRIEGFSESGLRGIRIVIEDDGAFHPLRVELLTTSPAWTAEGNQAGALFGYAVSTAGDVNGDGFADVIVGADFYDGGQRYEGRAFVYHGSAAGLSTTPSWTAESDQVEALFGFSVANAGDVNGDGFGDVVVGAISYDNGEFNEGRAFVYHGSATGLSPTPSWTGEYNQTLAQFGYSVATAGDVNGDGYSDVIVGAYFYDNGSSDEGGAFVYHGSAAGLAATPAWKGEGNQESAYYGFSVGTAGDVDGDGFADVLVGARSYDNGQTDEGRAFLYRGSAGGLSPTASWSAESDQPGALFGYPVGTAGDVNGDGYADVIIGCHGFDNGENNEGRVFVYQGSAGGLSVVPAWRAEGNEVSAQFGIAATTAGDVNGDGYADVIVGARGFHGYEGGAFVYHGSPAGLQASPAWVVDSDQTLSEFGWSATTAGDVNGDGYADVIVGAHRFDNGETDEGRAFVYLGSSTGLAATTAWSVNGDQAGASFGASIASAGDVNGDGYADVLVGAPAFDNGQIDEGRVFAYYGSAAGLSGIPAWSAESDEAGAAFGSAAAGAGDVNGDGFSDVVVGAPGKDGVASDVGEAFVFLGSATGLANEAAWTAEGDRLSAAFGSSVAGAGDVNGDGFADVVIGAPFDSDPEPAEGAVFVYHGSETGLSPARVWTFESDQAMAELGGSVAAAGDVNGDGYGDLVVGAARLDNGETDEGRAFVIHGSAAGLGPTAVWAAEGDQAGALFGTSVATAGDVNGDGYADLIIGAPAFDNGEIDEGRAFVYHGGPGGLSPAAVWIAEGNEVGASFGASVATAGDVNGDGFADVLVGEPMFDNGLADQGGAYAYSGSVFGLAPAAGWSTQGGAAGSRFGISVATAGDVDGDGYADALVGAAGHDDGEVDEGRALLFQGNGGRGVSLRPRQRRSNDSGPIAQLGASDLSDGFRLDLSGRTPFGRGRVKLEWEVKPLGRKLTGIDSKVAVHTSDTGIAGASLSELETGLLDGQPYHWRARLRYDPVTAPFQQRSRWVTVPWNGWQEADLRTAPFGAGRVPAGGAGTPLTIAKGTGADLTLTWGASCVPTDDDYEIYEGVLGDYYSHEPRFCTTGGSTSITFPRLAGNRYYLVVPRNGVREGSYGRDGAGVERPSGEVACLPRAIRACP